MTGVKGRRDSTGNKHVKKAIRIPRTHHEPWRSLFRLLEIVILVGPLSLLLLSGRQHAVGDVPVVTHARNLRLSANLVLGGF